MADKKTGAATPFSVELIPDRDSVRYPPPLTNKVILRRHRETFLLEAYFIDDVLIRHSVAEATVDEAKERGGTLPVFLPCVLRFALTREGMAELVKEIGPFWENAQRPPVAETKE